MGLLCVNSLWLWCLCMPVFQGADSRWAGEDLGSLWWYKSLPWGRKTFCLVHTYLGTNTHFVQKCLLESMLRLGKSLISEIRFGSQRYVFNVLDLSPKIMKQLIIYLIYVISISFSQYVMIFEIFLMLDFKIDSCLSLRVFSKWQTYYLVAATLLVMKNR